MGDVSHVALSRQCTLRLRRVWSFAWRRTILYRQWNWCKSVHVRSATPCERTCHNDSFTLDIGLRCVVYGSDISFHGRRQDFLAGGGAKIEAPSVKHWRVSRGRLIILLFDLQERQRTGWRFNYCDVQFVNLTTSLPFVMCVGGKCLPPHCQCLAAPMYRSVSSCT